MALVSALSGILTPRDPIDPRLLDRALRPGRMQAIALPVVAEVRANPRGAARVVSQALRAARALHSNERRLVGDVIWDLIRFEELLAAATGGGDPLAHWTAWVTWLGADPTPEAGTRAPAARPLEDFLTERLEALEGDPIAQLAFAGSLDPALARALLQSFGPSRSAQILKACNRRAPTTLRVNLRATTRDRVQRALEKAGIPTHPTRWSAAGLAVQGRANLVGTAAFRHGHFEVQDEGSQLITHLIPPEARTLIDWCAGAGGKTLALAASHPRARIWSLDVRRSALDELSRRARRAGVRPEVRLHAERGKLPEVDAVLVDAPCSGSGVLRRHPEHRRTVTTSALRDLAILQRDILEHAAAHVRVGGTLVYATCSLLEEENETIVHGFLRTHDAFEVVPAAIEGLSSPYLRLAPDLHDTDGFFAAALRRQA